MSNIPLGEECYGCGNVYSYCDCPGNETEKVTPYCVLCGDDLEELTGTQFEKERTCGLCDLEVLAGIR